MNAMEAIGRFKLDQHMELRRAEEAIGREYLESMGRLAVSDRATLGEADAYRRAAGGLIGVEVSIDPTGELSGGREAPPEGHSYAVVVCGKEGQKLFWDNLNVLLGQDQL